MSDPNNKWTTPAGTAVIFTGAVIFILGCIVLIWRYGVPAILAIPPGTLLLFGLYCTLRFCFTAHIVVAKWAFLKRAYPRTQVIISIITVVWCVLSLGLLFYLWKFGGPPNKFNIWSPSEEEYARGFITTVLLYWIPIIGGFAIAPIEPSYVGSSTSGNVTTFIYDSSLSSLFIFAWVVTVVLLITTTIRYIFILGS